MKCVSFSVAVVTAALSLSGMAAAADRPKIPSGPGMAAVDAAAKAERYLLAFCWKTQNLETKSAEAAFNAVAARCHDRADAVSVQLTAPSNTDFVKKFDLSRAPAPLVLVIAPNGTVTLGKVGKVSEAEVKNAFLSLAATESLAAFQKGQLVLICFRREGAVDNAAAEAGVAAFKADPTYGKATQIVTVDTADPAEASFLAEMKVSSKSDAPVTVLLAPPSGIVTKLTGPVSKEALISALQAAGTCGPNGCGPNGCCPGDVCKPGQVPPDPARN